ncbi:MAG TPA: AAA family ATPase [Burkholderiaceae bacterium]|jgi:MSHA biogenesis protein MshM|nr:AAA family ATPase [Burkholderiaceae bacterium]
MYLTHFGLNAAPFALTPDTAFAFSSRAQREALDTLVLAVDGGEGFIKITGEVGTGKTLLCRRFLAHAVGQPSEARSAKEGSTQAAYRTAYIPNPCLSPRTLLLAIARELKIRVVNVNSDSDVLEALNRALLRLAARGLRVVVCLDEAQAMPVETLEALRLLSNLETEKHKLVQVVLFGQPELDQKLARNDLRQLRTRIAFHYELSALSSAETEVYLAHRLRVAGHRGSALFPAEVAQAVHTCARGVPRLVNIIAHKSLLLAYGQGCARVSMRQARAAAKDTPQARGQGLLALLAWTRRLRLRIGY